METCNNTVRDFAYICDVRMAERQSSGKEVLMSKFADHA